MQTKTAQRRTTTNATGSKLKATIKAAPVSAAKGQEPGQTAAKKKSIAISPEVTIIGALSPLPGSAKPSEQPKDWNTCKYEIMCRRSDILSFAIKVDTLDLGYSDKRLLKEALKDTIETMEELQETVENDTLSDEERQRAYRKAMQITVEGVKEKTRTIIEDAAAAIDRYLEAEGQEERYTSAMEALDSLLFARRSSIWDIVDMLKLVEALTKFLFSPEVGGKFYASTQFQPEHVAEYMGRMASFFKDLQKPDAEADIDRYMLKTRPHCFEYSDLSWLKFTYEKKAAKSNAAFRVDEDFDNLDA